MEYDNDEDMILLVSDVLFSLYPVTSIFTFAFAIPNEHSFYSLSRGRYRNCNLWQCERFFGKKHFSIRWEVFSGLPLENLKETFPTRKLIKKNKRLKCDGILWQNRKIFQHLTQLIVIKLSYPHLNTINL